MNNKYTDIPSTIQVIGCLYQEPKIMNNDKYKLTLDDFVSEFHKVIFGAISNLYHSGAKTININIIEDYLAEKPKSLAEYKAHKGNEWLLKISETVQLSTFEYYYNRLKKMTLLRMYDAAGMDLSWFYDVNNILDIKKKQSQEEWLDNTSLREIAEQIERKITEIKIKYVDNTDDNFEQAGDNVQSLIERLQTEPEFGYPMFSGCYLPGEKKCDLLNSVTRGARLGKFYLRSAATGVGKTRAMIADACNFACNEIFDIFEDRWISNGPAESTLFITTEQEKDEVQTMMLAFLSGVNESHIIYNEYQPGELDRVIYAGKLLSKSPIYIKVLPNFSIQDIENTIKYSYYEHKVKYVCFDYLHTSMKILEEVSSKTGIKGLREDNVLFMMSIKLKDLCNEFGIFIITSTQLNADYKTAQEYDQNLLRGAKSIADKIDLGMIMLQVSKEDKEALKPILTQKSFPEPLIKMSIYKNRRGQYKDILLWCKANRGTCRIEPIFATDYQYHLVEITNPIKLIVEK